ncbi:MAG: methyltransferase domain-containing protein [Candidatus Omnitrophica bacterium]|nr:methyltransferase domain-containing protein [Candidatus Omnitrophota bacterium]
MGKLIWRREKYLWLIKYPFKTVEEVRLYYLLESQRVIDSLGSQEAVVLKTDLFNEAEALPLAGGIIGSLKRAGRIHAIEIQEQVKDKAKLKIGELKTIPCSFETGDIRRLNFDKGAFDCVIDLSTADHINPIDLEKLFSEYNKVLKRTGILLLVVWADISDSICINQEVNTPDPNVQYFFNKKYLLKTIGRYFAVVEEEAIYIQEDNTQHQLIRLICRKNDVWAYLFDEKMDYRVWLAAGYLRDKVKEKIIVDLDCGHAPLLKYIPDTYRQYIGNDIRNLFPALTERSIFYLKKDDDFIQALTKVDILVVLGYGGYEITKESLESKTLLGSIKTIISKFEPEIVVFETVRKFLPILKDVEEFAISQGYQTKCLFSVKMDDDENWLKHRELLILEKIQHRLM